MADSQTVGGKLCHRHSLAARARALTVFVCLCARARVCVCARARVCLCVCVRACVRVCVVRVADGGQLQRRHRSHDQLPTRPALQPHHPALSTAGPGPG